MWDLALSMVVNLIDNQGFKISPQLEFEKKYRKYCKGREIQNTRIEEQNKN